MGFYNSYILTGGSKQASNLEDLYESVERQAGWVDSIHIQNDFVSLSHLELEVEETRAILQQTIDDFFDRTYLYLNFPLIDRFKLRVPYDLSLHNVDSNSFQRCLRARLAPTVECGSYKAWPCGKYSGAAKPHDQQTFDSIPEQLRDMRLSADFKNGLQCKPCIHSSYNQSLAEIERKMAGGSNGRFFHYYEKEFVERTCRWSSMTGPT